MVRSSNTGAVRRILQRRRNEAGAILILASAMSICMLLIASIVVDIGAQRARRAQYQSVADGAALMALYQINHGVSFADASENVIDYVNRNLGLTAAAWENCGDAKELNIAPQLVAHNNHCISFQAAGSNGSNLGRVKIPVEEWSPMFGLGLVTLKVSAVAGAEGASGVCDESDIAGCETTTTAAPTTTIAPTTAAPTTTGPIPVCLSDQMLGAVWWWNYTTNSFVPGWTYDCFTYCPPGQEFQNQWTSTPDPNIDKTQYVCVTPPPTTTAAPTTTSPPTTAGPTTSAAPTTTAPVTIPPTTTPPVIDIEF